MVLGYDKDSRELWEIPEVVAYFEMLTPAIKHWLFFLRTDPPAHGMQLLACCLCGASRRGSVTPNKKVQVKFNDQKLRNFIEWQFAWLNEMTERLGMTVKENERICRRAMVAIGLGEPPENV